MMTGHRVRVAGTRTYLRRQLVAEMAWPEFTPAELDEPIQVPRMRMLVGEGQYLQVVSATTDEVEVAIMGMWTYPWDPPHRVPANLVHDASCVDDNCGQSCLGR